MRKFGAVLLSGIIAILAVRFGAMGHAQVIPYEFTCIGAKSGAPCPDGTTSLRGFSSTTAPAPYTYVSVAGYFSASDAGGGTFVRLGSTAGSSPVCVTYSGSGTINQGKNTVKDLSSITGLVVGESVSNGAGTTGVPPGAEIASIDSSNDSVTMTLPATADGTKVAINGDNGGTLILDSVSGNQDCYQKTNYRGDPHEFAALGDGVTDDTIPLENWMGAYGNVNANANFVPATAPPNFGPWNASIPANYMVTAPLYCPDNTLIQGLATQSRGPSPLVRIFAARQTNQTGPTFSGTPPAAVLTLGNRCRLSGVAVDGSGLQMNGTTHGTTTVDNLASTKNVQLGDIVIAADIPAGTTVTGVGSPSCSTPPCVSISVAASGTNSELISFNGPNAVAISGSRATIDGHSLVENGYNNVACTSTAMAGLQLKDSQFTGSGADDLALGGCPNVRVIGNVISGAGGRGVRFGGTDITVANNVIEQSAGTGLDLTGAEKLSVNGNFLDDNGKGLNGGPAIEITNVTTASICNNHMTGNGEYSSPYPAQVHFGGTNDGIVVCGNAYGTENQTGDATLKPSYAYDADTGTVLTNSHLYETPPPQVLGVYSPNAQAILPQLQVPQVVPQQITGFTLANSGSTAVAVAAGVAADSSNSVLIPNSGMCTVDLAAANGAGGLDTGSAHQNTTYFYFAIAQASGAIPAGVQSCIASASQTPTFRNTALGQYEITTTMSASSGDNYIYDVGSVAGIRINDELRANAYIPSAVSKRG